MKSRISILFATIALVSTVSHVSAMRPVKTLTRATKKQLRSWVNAIDSALTGEIPATVAVTQLNSIPNDPFPFQNLPKEIQNQIILNLNLFGLSEDLTTTGKAINNLAQVNKQLNNLINEPAFYRRSSRSLADRFNTSNEKVANALQTEAAKRELALQKELYDLCSKEQKIEPGMILRTLVNLKNQGVDFNFTDRAGDTPLTRAIYLNPDLAPALIEIGADLNATDGDGNTPLNVAIATENDELIKLIKHKLQSNQKK